MMWLVISHCSENRRQEKKRALLYARFCWSSFNQTVAVFFVCLFVCLFSCAPSDVVKRPESSRVNRCEKGPDHIKGCDLA